MSEDWCAIPDMRDIENSSNVAAIGHDEGGNMLHVRFKNGSHYAYEGVDADLAQRVFEADSPGRFLYSEIRGRFQCGRIA